MPIQHGTITGDAVHVPYAGTFANAAARTGATGLDSTQHGKLFRQLDDNSLWMLASTSPLTWKSLSPDWRLPDMRTMPDMQTTRETLGR